MYIKLELGKAARSLNHSKMAVQDTVKATSVLSSSEDHIAFHHYKIDVRQFSRRAHEYHLTQVAADIQYMSISSNRRPLIKTRQELFFQEASCTKKF